VLLLAALLAAGCSPTITNKHGISDQAPTGDTLRQLQDESAPYRARGSGAVHGHVSVQTPAGAVAARAGSRVLLLPATDYAAVRFAAFVIEDDTLPPAVRAAAIAQANVDAQGDFTLENLPPGSYLIASELFWTAPDGASRSAVPYARFDLADGVRVEVAVTRATP
jgi:hypothetical protein